MPKFRDTFQNGQSYTVEEIEAASLEKLRERNREFPDARPAPEVPFGHMAGAWKTLKAKAEPGDRFVYFCSPQESWKHLAGREGFFLLRGDVRLGAIVTAMN